MTDEYYNKYHHNYKINMYLLIEKLLNSSNYLRYIIYLITIKN